MTRPAAADLESHLARRLAELRTEYDLGQRQLAGLEARAGALRDTLLRIVGAIQVLEETMAFTASLPPRAAHGADEPAPRRVAQSHAG